MWAVWAVVAESDVSARETDGSGVDRTLLGRMAQGDGDALADLYDRHARPVYSLAVRILRDGITTPRKYVFIMKMIEHNTARLAAARLREASCRGRPFS